MLGVHQSYTQCHSTGRALANVTSEENCISTGTNEHDGNNMKNNITEVGPEKRGKKKRKMKKVQ